MLVSEKS